MTRPKRADEIAREVMREQSEDRFMPEERTCLTVTIYLHLNSSTEAAFHNGTRAMLQEIEASVKKHMPVAAIGYPPVIISWSQMP